MSVTLYCTECGRAKCVGEGRTYSTWCGCGGATFSLTQDKQETWVLAPASWVSQQTLTQPSTGQKPLRPIRLHESACESTDPASVPPEEDS